MPPASVDAVSPEHSPNSLLASPANDVHVGAGATFAPFAGWSMPISYGGVVAEHNAVREAVGIFDVSHLGKILVTGTGAAEYINSTLTNDLQRISPGKAQYTLCCDESGGVVDDLIVYLVSESEVFLIPNAANTAEVARRLEATAPAGVSVQDQHRDHAVLAVQGPRSAELLELEELPTTMPYMAFADATWEGAGGSAVRICRTGYTGEQGYEIVLPSSAAKAALQRLADRAEQLGGRLAGLGARDTLRTEMGYPLHGHELSLEITPVEARCGWAVGWRKPAFWGREALQRQREAGPGRTLWGLRALGKGVLRPGLSVLGAENKMIGTTTSGTFSPTLKTGIALALLDTSADITAGATVTVDVRGRHIPCEVVRPPFVAPRTQ